MRGVRTGAHKKYKTYEKKRRIQGMSTNINHITQAYHKKISILFTCLCLFLLSPFHAIWAGDKNGFCLEDHLNWDGYAWTEINGNTPYFTDSDLITQAYEDYSDLDELGRCGRAMACLGPETLPAEKRGEIGSVKPSGWHTAKYPDRIADNYLYNRCHLIAYELSAENANEKNLVTGTRYMNVNGMLDFENQTAWFIKNTGYHVLYRSTPVFKDNELVCRGILLEAKSVEDRGKGLCFCVWCPNVQPLIRIDYATGDSWPDDTVIEGQTSVVPEGSEAASTEQSEKEKTVESYSYAINIKSNIFHRLTCPSVEKMSPANRLYSAEDRSRLIEYGFKPCGNCNP